MNTVDMENTRAQNGRLYVVSAPSGAGKTTLCEAARQHLPHLIYSVSSTTRSPRAGEQEGKDYFFVSVDQFREGIQKGQWAEWAKVHDNYYGTSAAFIDAHRAAGRDVLLDIDVQGARQIAKRYPDAVTIFIMAPSLNILRERLKQRGLDSDAVIARRMHNAQAEIDRRGMYRHVVINDDLDTAIDRFLAILKGRSG
jgi:guanylate kinase